MYHLAICLQYQTVTIFIRQRSIWAMLSITCSLKFSISEEIYSKTDQWSGFGNKTSLGFQCMFVWSFSITWLHLEASRRYVKYVLSCRMRSGFEIALINQFLVRSRGYSFFGSCDDKSILNENRTIVDYFSWVVIVVVMNVSSGASLASSNSAQHQQSAFSTPNSSIIHNAQQQRVSPSSSPCPTQVKFLGDVFSVNLTNSPASGHIDISYYKIDL